MFSLEHTLHLLISREEFPACTATRGDNILEDGAWMTCYVCQERKHVYSTYTHTQSPTPPTQHFIQFEKKEKQQTSDGKSMMHISCGIQDHWKHRTHYRWGEVPAAVWQKIQEYPLPYHQTTKQLFFPVLWHYSTHPPHSTLTWSLAVMWFFYSLAFYIFVCSRGNYKLCFII